MRLLSLFLVAVLILGAGAVSACDNGKDDDGDGLADLLDPGCASPADTSELNALVACDNGEDDDGDGLADSLDPGCASPADTSELNVLVACDNGTDDDGDGLADSLDPDCESPADTSELNASMAEDSQRRKPRRSCRSLTRQIDHFEGTVLKLARDRDDALWAASTEKHINQLKNKRADQCAEYAEKRRVLARARAQSERFMKLMQKAARGAAKFFSGGLY